jgi:UTP:GlnB (protein PII) uridylyltransferase
MAAPLQQLTEAAGTDFPHLFAARELTVAKLAERRPRLQQLQHDEDVAIVLMGSWGRSEVTSGSDDDYMVLVTGEMRDEVRPAKAEIETILDRAPGEQGIFGEPVSSRVGVDVSFGPGVDA